MDLLRPGAAKWVRFWQADGFAGSSASERVRRSFFLLARRSQLAPRLRPMGITRRRTRWTGFAGSISRRVFRAQHPPPTRERATRNRSFISAPAMARDRPVARRRLLEPRAQTKA